MSRRLSASIAASVDAPPQLAPVLRDLFQGIDALGSLPGRTVTLLNEAGARPSWRILDLACGKGAIAVRAAATIGCRVVGVDGCEPFIDSARALARRRGVSRRCRFELADVRTWRDPRPFHAAMMIGLFPLGRAARLLRAHVRPGGAYLIDDCIAGVGFEGRGVPTRAQCERLITRLGDRVEAVHIPTPAAIRRQNAALYGRLRTRAAAVRRARPDLGPHLAEFLRRQREANRLLERELRPAIWVVTRGRGD